MSTVVRCYRYYMETTAPKTVDDDQNQLKKWLMARTVGSPTAWNRLLNFHLVRSTKAVVYTAPMFVQDACSGLSSLRTAEHLVQHPAYPDPVYYLSFLGKYFYRNPSLRHLRIEQFRVFYWHSQALNMLRLGFSIVGPVLLGMGLTCMV